MKKMIALTVSSALLLNSFQVAMASPTTDQVKYAVDRALSEKEIIELLATADSKTTEELVSALKEVRGLMDKLNEISSVNESDAVLKYANRVQIVLVALTAYTMNAHLKSKEATNAILALSTVSMGLNAFITRYKESHKVDATMLSKIVFETSKELSKTGNLTPELEKITGSLNTISSALLENQSQISGIVANLGGTQDMALLASFSYLLLHLVYPKLAKQTDGFLKNILPRVQQGVVKTTELAKKPIAYGATGATGIPDILSMTLGLSSEQSQKLIMSTLINLDTTANKLDAEIKNRSKK
ncbi:MAG: hypothetical protein A2622_00440 [Bdellovibrionales bacterium RIFCSPHIGHO2_01_FULL_40_29]|nr:MAG: hypothetical protein A2622_00440 [Bdellovibrionales bacterium RIFCSPHIGHO2_01_FULL_40_29]OFZ32592.1 MAG: hypothetical protein A3D17_05040 [Bdellovibrionales bacterium RIFCSPHIGHO2_02_FULL_40_15]